MIGEWKDYNKEMRRHAQANRIPQASVFELTPLCNFNCKMCYIHLSGEQMKPLGTLLPAERWIDMGRQVLDAGGLFLQLTGGEVFTRPDFREIYESLAQMGFLISIFSNGYLIDDHVISWLKEMPPLNVRVTIYGASNQTYERVCGICDGYDIVTRNIRKMQEVGITVEMSMTIVKENMQDISEVKKLATELEIPCKYSGEVVKSVRGANNPVEQVRLAMGSMLEETKEGNVYIRNIEKVYPNKSIHPLEICGSRNRGFWLTWSGKMTLCAFMDVIGTFPFESGFLSAWHELCERMDQLKNHEKCKDCKYIEFCKACPGLLEAECGNPEGIDEVFCRQAKMRYEQYN